MRNTRQSGFSLLELLVAMTILAVIGTIGFVQLRTHAARARHIKARDYVETVSKGLDHYYLKHGFYPVLGSFESMVDGNSPLVKENFIPVNWPSKDPWDQPLEGTSVKGSYVLKCAGDPGNLDEFGPFTIEPGKYSDSSQPSAPTADTTPEAPK